MNNLTYEQRIALQMGELVLEVRRLEAIQEQMAKRIFELEEEKNRLKNIKTVSSKE